MKIIHKSKSKLVFTLLKCALPKSINYQKKVILEYKTVK